MKNTPEILLIPPLDILVRWDFFKYRELYFVFIIAFTSGRHPECRPEWLVLQDQANAGICI
jgi:hypothetical protein